LVGEQVALRLRRRRSARYLRQMARLDAGVHQRDPALLDELLRGIESELGDLALDQRPLGIVARCHLGVPYEVHTLDFSGAIIEHFESFRSMPPPFERARSLAAHGAYELIEVYPDVLRAVGADGSVAVI
jgi:hypothetical protein